MIDMVELIEKAWGEAPELFLLDEDDSDGPRLEAVCRGQVASAPLSIDELRIENPFGAQARLYRAHVAALNALWGKLYVAYGGKPDDGV